MKRPMQEPTFWVLTALAGGRSHGYALLRDVRDLTDGRVHLGVTTLYAALERLVRDGWVAYDGEEVVEGRRRRYAVLTADGAAALAAEAARLDHASTRAAARLRINGWVSRTGAVG